MKRGRKPVVFTLEKALEVRRRVRAGERVTDVCPELGMDHSRFCRWCRKNKFQVHTALTKRKAVRRPRPKPTVYGRKPEVTRLPAKGSKGAAVLKDLKAGLSIKKAAAKHGVSISYAGRVRIGAGLAPAAGVGRNFSEKRPENNLTHKARAAAKALKKGQKQAEIARRLGVSSSFVMRVKTRLAEY